MASKKTAKKVTKKAAATKDIGGRPEAVITFKELRKLAAFGMTREEMADFLGVSRITLYNHIQKYPDLELAIAEGSGKMAMSIKRKQYNLAKKGNPAMLIWVGKQHLGQKDKIETVDNPLPPKVEALLSTFSKKELLEIAGLERTGSTDEDPQDSSPPHSGEDT